MKNYGWVWVACLGLSVPAFAERLLPLNKSANAPLQDAIGRGQTGKAIALLKHGADPNAQNGSFFRWAIVQNNEPLVREFLVRGAKITPQASESALRGDGDGVRMLEILLNHGANPNAVVRFEPTDDEGERDGEASPHTLLMIAAEENKLAAARLLVARGAKINTRLGNFTALRIAALQSNLTFCNLLLNRGAGVAGGQEPLLRTAVHHNDLAFFARLQKLRALPQPMRWPLDLEGLSLLMAQRIVAAGANSSGDANSRLLSGSPLSHATFQKDVPLARFLLDKGARVEADVLSQSVSDPFLSPLQRKQQEQHWRALRENAKRQDPFFEENDFKNQIPPAAPEDNRLLALFLEHGAPLNAPMVSRRRDRNGETTLHVAAWANRPEAIRLLLQHGANIEARGAFKRTPLFAAIEGQSDLAFSALLDAGANIEARDDVGATPLLRAVGVGGGVTFYEPLSVAVEPDASFSIVQTLIARGADVGATSNNGATALHLASIKGRADTMKLLLEHGASLDAPNKSGQTPLALACMMGQFEAARLLLQRGANPDAPDKMGQTPRQLVTQPFVLRFHREGKGAPSRYELHQEQQFAQGYAAPINAGRRKIAALFAAKIHKS